MKKPDGMAHLLYGKKIITPLQDPGRIFFRFSVTASVCRLKALFHISARWLNKYKILYLQAELSKIVKAVVVRSAELMPVRNSAPLVRFGNSATNSMMRSLSWQAFLNALDEKLFF
jgi:hypothetical protein